MKQAKEIKKKVRTIRSIEHITRAMKMVAAAKLKKAQGRLEAIGPYSDGIARLTADLLPDLRRMAHPFTVRRAIRRRLVVVITSDKGLCGSYNSNVLRRFEAMALELGLTRDNIAVLPIGRKAGDYFAKRGYELFERAGNGDASPSFASVEPLMARVLSAFTAGGFDEVRVIFTRFVSTIRYAVEIETLLPLSFGGDAAEGADEAEGAACGAASDYLFEPDRAAIVGFLLPRIVMVRFYRALIDSITAEHACRMTSMGSATDKSNELINTLTLMLNKARQATITMEILDIVGGAEALKR